MGSKTLLILFVAAAAVVGAAYLVVDKGSESEARESTLLFEDLAAHVNDVAEITAESGDSSVTLRGDDDEGWVLVERGNYPADFSKVQEVVVRMSRLEIEEPKTAKPENHSLLGVEDPTAEGSNSKRVTLRDASGNVLAAAIVGDSKPRRGSTALFVRRDGEDQVYLCEGSLSVDPSPTNWIEREIIRLETERVESVQIQHASGEEVLIGRSSEDPTKFTLVNVPEGREEAYAGVATAVASPLAYLGLEDVEPLAEVDFGAEPVATTTFTCKDGMVLVAKTAKLEDKTWLHLTASYQPVDLVGPSVPEPEPAPEAEPDAETSPDEAAAIAAEEDVEPEGPTPEEVQSEVEELNSRVAEWAFAIPSYKAEVLARNMEDLLKDLDAEPEPRERPDDLPLSMEELFDPEPARDLLGGAGEEPSEPAEPSDGTPAPDDDSSDTDEPE